MRAPFVLLVALTCFADDRAMACNIVDGKMYGDCAGVTVRTEPHPKFIARGYHEIDGMYEGADVLSGATLVVEGIVQNTITVSKGGHLLVNGIVADVECNGGVVQVDGQAGLIQMNGGTLKVSGIVRYVRGIGAVHYAPGAVVDGVPYVHGFNKVLR